MQNNLTKRAVLGGLVASHLGQNLIGKPIANSAWFRKDVAKSGIMGALGKQSPRNAKSYAKDASMGVIAPEVNITKNTAYQEGRNKAKDLHNKIRKDPKYIAARARQKAGKGDLHLPMDIKRDLVSKRKEFIRDTGVTKKEINEISSLPKGNRPPSSTKAAVGANLAAAIIPGGASTAAVNAVKLTGGTKAYTNSKLGKHINKKLFKEPIRNQYVKGKTGSKFSTLRNKFESLVVNPFTAKVEQDAYKVGARSTKVKKDLKTVIKQKAKLPL